MDTQPVNLADTAADPQAAVPRMARAHILVEFHDGTSQEVTVHNAEKVELNVDPEEPEGALAWALRTGKRLDFYDHASRSISVQLTITGAAGARVEPPT